MSNENNEPIPDAAALRERRRGFLLGSLGVTGVAATLASRPALGNVMGTDCPKAITMMCSPVHSHGAAGASSSTGYHADWWCGDIRNWHGVNCVATFKDFGFPSGCGVNIQMRLRDALVAAYQPYPSTLKISGYTGGFWTCSQPVFSSNLSTCIATGLLNAQCNSGNFGYTTAEFVSACKTVLLGGLACYTKLGVQAALAQLLASICQQGRRGYVGGLYSCWDTHYFPK